MILTLTNKIKDFQSPLKDQKLDKIFKIEINIKNANFVQENGMSQFFQSLSKLVNLSHLTLNLTNQKFGVDAIQSLSQSVLSMSNLLSFSLESTKSMISVNEYNSLFSSICSHSNIKNIGLISNNYSCLEGESLKIFKYLEHIKSIESFRFQFKDNNNIDLASILYDEKSKIMKLNINDFKLDETLIKSLPLIIKNMQKLENFVLNSQDKDISTKDLSQLFISLGNLHNLQKLQFKIQENKIVQEEYFSLFKYLVLSKSLNSLIFEFSDFDYKNQASIKYEQQQNKIDLDFSDFQLNENNAQSLSLFIKSLEDLQKIKINFCACKVPACLLISLFSFFTDHKSIRYVLFNYSRQKVTSEQLYALTQSLKQSKSLKQLEIELSRTELEEQANEMLSQQLSQLENIQTLKYRVIFDKIDISTSFVDEIVKNKQIQELEIMLFHLEQNINYELNIQKLLSMSSLKSLKLYFQLTNNYGKAIQFFKNLNSIKQTNLQKLTIALDNELLENNQKEDNYAQLGQYLSAQTIIYNLEIQMIESNFIEASTSLIKQLKNPYLKTFQFIFKNWRSYLFTEELKKLKTYAKKKMTRAVKLEFN